MVFSSFRLPSRSAACLLAAALFLGGCLAPPRSRLDARRLPSAPDAWAVAPAPAGDFEPLAWVEAFNDPRLEALVREALEGNFSLRAALSRLEAAEQTAVLEGAGRWPGLSIGHSGARAKRNTSDGTVRTAAVTDTFALTGRVSWELDLWGRLRDTARAGLADYEASVEDLRSARLALAARVAGVWYDVVEAEQQLALAERNLRAFEDSVEVVEGSFRRGIATALDVHLIRANLATARSAYEQRLRARDGLARVLETLLGRYPRGDAAPAASLPEALPPARVGAPADLVARRPDLRAAERRLAALDERAAAAFKDRLPNLALTATGGTSSSDFGVSFDVAQNQVWSLAYGLTAPLFQGGRLRAAQRRAEATYEQAVHAFANTLLTAFREVEDALAGEASLERDVAAQRIAVDESVAAERQAWDQYQRGLVDIITVIESQRRSITAQRSLIQTTNERVQTRIDLHLALGGGLEPAPASPTSPP